MNKTRISNASFPYGCPIKDHRDFSKSTETKPSTLVFSADHFKRRPLMSCNGIASATGSFRPPTEPLAIGSTRFRQNRKRNHRAMERPSSLEAWNFKSWVIGHAFFLQVQQQSEYTQNGG